VNNIHGNQRICQLRHVNTKCEKFKNINNTTVQNFMDIVSQNERQPDYPSPHVISLAQFAQEGFSRGRFVRKSGKKKHLISKQKEHV